MERKEFHISVAATPESKGMMLNKEIQMLKVSLLYADKTKLYSLTTHLFMLLVALTNLNFDQKLDLLEQLLPSMLEDIEKINQIRFALQTYRNLAKKKNRKGKEPLIYRQIKVKLEKIWDEQVIPHIETFLINNGLNQFEKALVNNILEIHIFSDFNNTESIIKEYLDTISNQVLNGITFPLFDELTIDLMKYKMDSKEVIIQRSVQEQLKHTGLLSKLIERLPCFEDATIDEIIDIRKELEKPLINFRSSLFEFSEDLQSNIWDKDFGFDVNKTYYQKVEPAVLEIENRINENQYLLQLLKKSIDNKMLTSAAITTGLGLAIAGFTDFSKTITIALTTILGITEIGVAALLDKRKETKDIENNQMFFYYQTGKLLE